MKKILILFILMATSVMAVDIQLEQNSSDQSQLDTSSKAYFGEQIFQGNFKENKQFRYNPDYLINVGDVISVKLWGAYEFSADLTVDKQGKIFIPKIGDITLLGLKNSQLKSTISRRVKQVFNHNVFVYADIK